MVEASFASTVMSPWTFAVPSAIWASLQPQSCIEKIRAIIDPAPIVLNSCGVGRPHLD